MIISDPDVLMAKAQLAAEYAALICRCCNYFSSVYFCRREKSSNFCDKAMNKNMNVTVA